MALWNMISFQDPATPIMEQLIIFHDHTLMILIMITTGVLYMISSLFTNKLINRNMLESQMIELVWTILPAAMLITIALPSLKILYLLEEINKPMISMKAIGHQWYWSYEFSDFKNIEFDSYMKNTKSLNDNEYRLLEVDNRIVLPFNTKTRILVTSLDVIHSWTVPALGIKVDGTPGRINQGSIMMSRPGVYYGQCSEICGANHSFMPIMIESVNMKSFMTWIKNFS
uniref:cytochrome c oxidase subunit II n=1 Tax=Nesophrosyne sp. 126 GMB-2012 TaxID=1223897 RepID=UPI0021820BFB|nr:cytochrome c oxidase subunit II [Nesophrosyne sp. 126 GMB-2012]UVI59748.1 cytochrome c oxidase subunit II [Nesophrosyne sp. 126 GMB-2012]